MLRVKVEVTTKIKNLSRLERKLSNLPKNLSNPVKQEVFLGAESIRRTAINLINRGSRSGVAYKRGNKSAQRSAPGEPPKSDRGILVGSIFNVPIHGLGGFANKVGTKKEYGASLEFGTSKMDARPWLFPSYKQNINDIIKNVTKALKLSIRGSV